MISNWFPDLCTVTLSSLPACATWVHVTDEERIEMCDILVRVPQAARLMNVFGGSPTLRGKLWNSLDSASREYRGTAYKTGGSKVIDVKSSDTSSMLNSKFCILPLRLMNITACGFGLEILDLSLAALSGRASY